MPTLEELMQQVLKDRGLDPALARQVLDPETVVPDELARAARAVLERMTQESPPVREQEAAQDSGGDPPPEDDSAHKG